MGGVTGAMAEVGAAVGGTALGRLEREAKNWGGS